MDFGGYIDFVTSHLYATSPTWVSGMIRYLANPPDWLTLAVIAAGLLLIYWDVRRRAPLKEGRVQKGTAEQPTPQRGAVPSEGRWNLIKEAREAAYNANEWCFGREADEQFAKSFKSSRAYYIIRPSLSMELRKALDYPQRYVVRSLTPLADTFARGSVLHEAVQADLDRLEKDWGLR